MLGQVCRLMRAWRGVGRGFHDLRSTVNNPPTSLRSAILSNPDINSFSNTSYWSRTLNRPALIPPLPGSKPQIIGWIPTISPMGDPGRSKDSILDFLDPEKILPKISPEAPNAVEKQAARLIVIRRSKMNKHRLRKIRKRDFMIIRNLKMRREKKKEQAFQAEIFGLMKEAEAFNAEEWVKDFIQKSNQYAKKKEEEEFYKTEEGLKVKLKLIEEAKRTKPSWWKD